jgi:hypothetical protein
MIHFINTSVSFFQVPISYYGIMPIWRNSDVSVKKKTAVLPLFHCCLGTLPMPTSQGAQACSTTSIIVWPGGDLPSNAPLLNYSSADLGKIIYILI